VEVLVVADEPVVFLVAQRMVRVRFHNIVGFKYKLELENSRRLT